ncbi:MULTISPECIES: DUF2777 domain-containing protein [Bacillales]|jgi:hypothetical protein|uniref:DUF2777 domain-containing protein n=1 Tax=Peribacillus simplex TaxID=1478 RepID=A0A9W4PHM7_9BACI|nr:MULTISPECIES: DUF2777 domain-containing protein [Bacillales]MBT2669524.1 DUF2777 domain-containing protein [Streptomyces sp. ISL-14]MDR4927139.1 DUF2777 domain-containing protein [Peribacillus simplex]PEZ81753.1 DUF2777 domain-containing protein [Bacillus sp. AFS017274]QOS88135.1 DUF2777 domain-containing protein [Brevibacillus sp. JNUCC-41]WHX92424.1 DUF2777 domain-containing protein [Peribacillus simplex]
MSQQQRIKLMNRQTRAFTEGTVENINQQWIFFDDETDEACSIEDHVDSIIEVYRGGRWQQGVVEEEGKILLHREITFLRENEPIRIRKKLLYSFERLLEELNDDSFFQFVTTLNSLDFSIYDCIYSYNQLTFLRAVPNQSGVNFFTFDNESQICLVQHHFSYGKKDHDRFEFTLNTGKRIVIEKVNSQ